MPELAESIVNGLIHGAVYALLALGFVVTYKTMRVANFALGEFVLFGAGFAAVGYHVLALGLMGAVLTGCAGMAGLAFVFNRVVFARVGHARPITLLMLTLGLGSFLQALAPWLFRASGFVVPLPLAGRTVTVRGVLLSADELAIGGVAVVAIAALAAFFRWSRPGLALRAMAEDPAVAGAMGVDVKRYGTLAWGLAGCTAVVGGILWSALRGGGFGLSLLGLRIFPIVIIGGLDSMPGTILGGLAIGLLDSLVATYLDVPLGANVSDIVSFAVLVSVLLLRPQGILGTPQVERV